MSVRAHSQQRWRVVIIRMRGMGMGCRCPVLLVKSPAAGEKLQVACFQHLRFRCYGFSLKLAIHLRSGPTNCRQSFFAHHPAFDLNPWQMQSFAQRILFSPIVCFYTRSSRTGCFFFVPNIPSIPVNRGWGEEQFQA